MKKLKRILGCVLIGALSLVMAVTTLVTNKANTDASTTVYTPEYYESLFDKAGSSTVTFGTYMPEYITKRGYWEGPSNGIKLTFKSEADVFTYKNTLTFEQAKKIVSFTALPSEKTFNKTVVEFKNFYVTLYEVKDGQKTGKQVVFVYSSAHTNVKGMMGKDKGGEVSSYFSAYAQNNDSQVQQPYALVGGTKYVTGDGTNKTSKIADETIVGTPECDGSGAGGATSIQASMQDTEIPMVFAYSQTGSKETNDLVCKGYIPDETADHPRKDGGTVVRRSKLIRVFNEYRNPTDVLDASAITTKHINDPVIFDGFDADSKFKVSFSIDAFAHASSEASFLIYDIGGAKFQNRLEVNGNYKGVKNQSCPIPTPTLIQEDGTKVNADNFDYNVKITGPALPIPDGSPEGTEPENFTLEGAKLTSFVPTVEGEYVISYTANSGGTTYGYNLKMTVVETIGDILIENVSKPTDFNNVYGSNYLVYAEANSPIYTDSTTPPLTIGLYKVNGASETFVKSLAVNELLNLKSLNLGFGNYIVRYYAKDVMGRELTVNVNLNQVESNRIMVSMLNGVNGSTENYYLGAEDVVISKNDVTVYDGLLGRDFINPIINIYKGEELTPYVVSGNEINFNTYFNTVANGEWGTYRIEYVYNVDFNGDTTIDKVLTLSKSLRVLDSVAPKIYATTESYIYGAKLDVDKSTTDGVYYFTAKKGTELKFGSLVASDSVGEKYSLTDRISLKIINPDKTEVEIKSKSSAGAGEDFFNAQNFKYLVTSNGQYVFRFDVYDEMDGVANNETSLVYIVDVENDFYKMEIANDYDISNNFDSFKLSEVKVIDYVGNVVNADVTVTATASDGEVVWTGVPGDVKKFDIADTYLIKVTAKVGGSVVAEKEYSVMIVDATKPQIVIEGDVVAKGVVGKEVVLSNVTATDENGYATITVSVKFGEQTINVYQNAFTPIESGTYVITYTALDLAGNENVYTYNLVIIDDYEGLLAKFFNSYGLFVAIPLVLVAVALIVLLKIVKGKKTKKEEIEETEDVEVDETEDVEEINE